MPTSNGLRLMLREEGTEWVAYVGRVGTLTGTVRIASINMAIAHDSPSVKSDFVSLAMAATEVAIKKIGAEVTKWNPPEQAPEHERSGHA